MDTPEKKQKTQKQETELDDKYKKYLEIERISKMIHPHDDDPDPMAHMGNYNFPQMLFAFCLGFVTMFVLSVNEIENFKGCPFPEYNQENFK